MSTTANKETENPKATETEKPEPRWGLWMLGVGILVLVVLGTVAGIQYLIVDNFVQKNGTDEVTRFGISGDFFGFANALFSALAFAMIIVTLWMQKYELKQQREELEITRDVLKQQQKEMADQNESLRRQTFENTFFGMLRMLKEIVDNVRPPQGSPQGHEAFREILIQLKQIFERHLPPQNASPDEELPHYLKVYENVYVGLDADLGHYFRTLYNLLRYIDENGGKQKRMYARLVRAQLSSNELELLLYNGLCKYGKEKMKPLIERYSLLKHLRRRAELDEWCKQYDSSAFGEERK